MAGVALLSKGERLAKSRFMRLLTAQPMTRRECRSRMTARYSQPSSRRSRTSLRRRLFSFSTSSCGPDIKSSCWCFWTHLFNVESPTPKSDATLGRVSPLLCAMRTASRLNSSVYLIEPPRVYRRVKLSKDGPYDTEKIHPELHG